MTAPSRPDPAASPDALAHDLSLLVWRLGRFARAASAVDGVPSSHVALLALLDADGALTGADLARRLGVTPQATATMIATLLAEGLVERVAADGDERRRPVGITAAGADVLARVRGDRAASLERDVLAGFDADQRSVLAQAVGLLAAAVDPRRAARA